MRFSPYGGAGSVNLYGGAGLINVRFGVAVARANTVEQFESSWRVVRKLRSEHLPCQVVTGCVDRISAECRKGDLVLPLEGDFLDAVKVSSDVLVEGCPEENVLSGRMEVGGAYGVAVPGRDLFERSPSKTLFCEDFDCRSQQGIASARLGLTAT